MSIKSILAPFTGKETDGSVANAALRIAKIFDAQIGVIYARGYAPEFTRLGMAEFGEVDYEQFEQAAQEQAEQMEIAVREHFLQLLDGIKADRSTISRQRPRYLDCRSQLRQ